MELTPPRLGASRTRARELRIHGALQLFQGEIVGVTHAIAVGVSRRVEAIGGEAHAPQRVSTRRPFEPDEIARPIDEPGCRHHPEAAGTTDAIRSTHKIGVGRALVFILPDVEHLDGASIPRAEQ